MPLVPESDYVVATTVKDITCQRPDGSMQRVSFADLHSVIIETNDQGPGGIDFWWVLSGEGETGCIFPQGATGERAVLESLTSLPDFDNRAFMEAVSSTRNESFICWRRPRALAGAD